MPRHYLSETELHRLIKREFQGRRPRGCEQCAVPTPFHTPASDEHSPNWSLGLTPVCPRRCNEVLAEIAIDLRERFDLM